jgi:predicted RNA-binding protein with RPS1 domain
MSIGNIQPNNLPVVQNAQATQTTQTATRTEENNGTRESATSNRTVEEYEQYLQDRYSFLNNGTSMSNTSVVVSPAFIRKAANDPEKAKFLEENLAAIPDVFKNSAENNAAKGRTIESQVINFDANGHISISTTVTNDPDGKLARENAAKKAKEAQEKKKEEDIKLEEKREKERAEQTEQAQSKELQGITPHKQIFASGNSMDEVMRNFALADITDNYMNILA